MVTRVHNWHTELCRAECSVDVATLRSQCPQGADIILSKLTWYRYGNFDHNLLGAALVIYTYQGTSWCGNSDHYIALWYNEIFVLQSSVVQSWQTTETGDVLETVIKKFSPGRKGRKSICNFAKYPSPEQKSKKVLCWVTSVSMSGPDYEEFISSDNWNDGYIPLRAGSCC